MRCPSRRPLSSQGEGAASLRQGRSGRQEGRGRGREGKAEQSRAADSDSTAQAQGAIRQREWTLLKKSGCLLNNNIGRDIESQVRFGKGSL